MSIYSARRRRVGVNIYPSKVFSIIHRGWTLSWWSVTLTNMLQAMWIEVIEKKGKHPWDFLLLSFLYSSAQVFTTLNVGKYQITIIQWKPQPDGSLNTSEVSVIKTWNIMFLSVEHVWMKRAFFGYKHGGKRIKSSKCNFPLDLLK